MDEDKLSELVEHFVRTESGIPQLSEFLCQTLANTLRTEIDAQLARASLRPLALPPADSNSSLDFWLHENGTSNGFLQLEGKAQAVARQMAKNSVAYKELRGRTLDLCLQQLHDLWRLRRPSGSAMEYRLEDDDSFWLPNSAPSYDFNHATDTNEHDKDDLLALSSFSLLDHSQRELPEEELHSMVGIVIAEQIEMAVRQNNLQKLMLVSPTVFANSKAFDIFLGHLHALLSVQTLFESAMHLLARLLNCQDESIWCKTWVCLCRVALNVMRRGHGLDLRARRSLALFFCQIFHHGPRIWRSFNPQSRDEIVQSCMELLTAETSADGGAPSPDGFLATFARADPRLDWIRPWLRDHQLREAMGPKLMELVNEVLEGGESDDNRLNSSPPFWAFQCCLLMHCLTQPPLLQCLRETMSESNRLEQQFDERLCHFFKEAFAPPPHRHGFVKARKAIADGLLEMSMSNNGATFLSTSDALLELFTLINHQNRQISSSSSKLDSLPLKTLLNIIANSQKAPSYFILPKLNDHLHQLIFASKLASFELRELATHVLALLLERFAPEDLSRALPQLPTLLGALLPRPDPSIAAHRRLMVAPCLLASSDAGRRKAGKILGRLWLRHGRHPRENRPGQPASWLSLPFMVRPSEEERRIGQRVLLQFLRPKELLEEDGPPHRQLDFLSSTSTGFHISQPMFVLLTQPGLLMEFVHSTEVRNELQRRFADFEGQRARPMELEAFLTRLDVLTVNLDFMAELRRLLPNLPSRLTQLSQKFCTASNGEPINCALSRQIDQLISHLILPLVSDQNIEQNDQLQDDDNWEAPSDAHWMRQIEEFGIRQPEPFGIGNGIKWPEDEDFVDDKTRALSLGLFEDTSDHFFWLSMLPTEDTSTGRRELLSAVFSPRWRAKCPLSAFALLRAYAHKFWVLREERRRLVLRPPPHSEWLPLVADYALALELAADRAQLRRQMSGLKLLAESPPDWFLSALFLSAQLDAESTLDLGERLLQRPIQTSHLDCIWPMITLGPDLQCSFDEHVAGHVLPQVLALLRQEPVFSRARALLDSTGVSSVLHLLLFYCQRAYLGILPFEAVQEYLLIVLLGGPEAQALHFCAVLTHISQQAEAKKCRHGPNKQLRLFLRPEFLADFAFTRFAHLLNVKRVEKNGTAGNNIVEFDEWI